MGKGKLTDIDKCKSGPDCLSYATHNGGEVVRQAGSHAIVKGSTGGICVIPIHNGDLPLGTKRSIMKQLVSIGIMIAIFILVILPVIRAVVEQYNL
jgi:predicted RNA binding protein YcfA (HicA-like mRNA interferase family)